MGGSLNAIAEPHNQTERMVQLVDDQLSQQAVLARHGLKVGIIRKVGEALEVFAAQLTGKRAGSVGNTDADNRSQKLIIESDKVQLGLEALVGAGLLRQRRR